MNTSGTVRFARQLTAVKDIFLLMSERMESCSQKVSHVRTPPCVDLLTLPGFLIYPWPLHSVFSKRFWLSIQLRLSLIHFFNVDVLHRHWAVLVLVAMNYPLIVLCVWLNERGVDKSISLQTLDLYRREVFFILGDNFMKVKYSSLGLNYCRPLLCIRNYKFFLPLDSWWTMNIILLLL